MTAPQRNIAAGLKPCGCWGILQTLEDNTIGKGCKVDAHTMVYYWKAIAKDNLEHKEFDFGDESWRAIPYECPKCNPKKFAPKQPELFEEQTS